MWDVEWIYGQLAIDGCNRHEEVAASYADSRANVVEFHDEVAEARDKSDAVVTITETYSKSSSNLIDLTGMLRQANIPNINIILEAINTTINHQNEHHSVLADSYKSLTWILGPMLTKIEETQRTIQMDLVTIKSDTSDIKCMVSKLFKAFKG
uniref:Uncharacterized protein n=1 Tax=Tanacetum cinerariifolium TaxID=118510 RepID=A0A6L2NH37_TANCI|nr:hypothetical protein [Tanacetum cinerariifolium]